MRNNTLDLFEFKSNYDLQNSTINTNLSQVDKDFDNDDESEKSPLCIKKTCKNIETIINSMKDMGVIFENTPNSFRHYWHENNKYLYLTYEYQDDNRGLIMVTTHINANMLIDGRNVICKEILMLDNLANLNKACKDNRIKLGFIKNHCAEHTAMVIYRDNCR